MSLGVKRRRAPYSKFKAFLAQNGIRQTEVAKLLGKSKSALNQNINGTGGDFSLQEVRLLCKYFQISADDYFLYPDVSDLKPDKEGNDGDPDSSRRKTS